MSQRQSPFAHGEDILDLPSILGMRERANVLNYRFLSMRDRKADKLHGYVAVILRG